MIRFASLLAMATALAMPGFAQFDTAEVLGVVKDPNGGVVAKASVVLLNQDTGIQTKTTTSDSGDFLFSNVKVGTYTLTAEAAGFSKEIATDVKVDVGARQRVDLSLKVGVVT